MFELLVCTYSWLEQGDEGHQNVLIFGATTVGFYQRRHLPGKNRRKREKIGECPLPMPIAVYALATTHASSFLDAKLPTYTFFCSRFGKIPLLFFRMHTARQRPLSARELPLGL